MARTDRREQDNKRSIAVTDSGAIAVEGDVTLTGGAVAGRDLIIERLTVLSDSGAPFGDAAARPGAPGDVCPYPGIRAFAAAQQSFYFGRDRDIDAVVDIALGTGFVAVVGASGSGKSSLLAAGVVPALQRRFADTGDDWNALALRPGTRPGTRLAQLVDRATLHDDRPLLVVVDQLEEVFARHVDVAERTAFLDQIVDLGERRVDLAKVLVALRSDFYPHLDTHRRMAETIAASQHRLLPLDAESLRDIVEGPAERVGLRVEPALIEQVLLDVDPDANHLPLLAYALQQTWRRRRNGWLTLAGYVDSGGVREALENGADSVWNSLSAEQRTTARRIFLRLVDAGEGRSATRLRVDVETLVTEADDLESVLDVLERFARARLLTPDLDDATGQPTVDITHEALLREWSVLRGWLEDDVESRRVQREVAVGTQAWLDHDRDPAYLFTGRRLEGASSAQRAGAVTLNERERQFLGASGRRAARERRRSRWLMVLPVGLVVTAVIAGVIALQQQRTAQQKTVSDSLQLASEARSLISSRRDVGALLAVAALRTDDNPTTLGTLVDAVAATDGPLAYVRLPDVRANAMASTFAPDGTAVIGASDGSVRFVSPSTGAETSRLELGIGGLSAISVGRDGTIVAGAGDGTVAVVLGDAPGPSPIQLRGPASPVFAVGFDTPRRVAVAVTQSGEVWMWRIGPSAEPLTSQTLTAGIVGFGLDEATGRALLATTAGKIVPLEVETGTLGAPLDIGFSGTGDVGLTATPDGRIVVVDSEGVQTTTVAANEQTSSPPDVLGGTAVAVAPAGDVAFVATSGGTVQTWALDPRPVPVGPAREGYAGPVRAVATNGETVVGLDAEGGVVTWDVAGRRSPASTTVAEHDNGALAVAIRPDGAVASGGREGAVKLTAPGEAARLVTEVGAAVRALTWLPDGELLVGAEDGTVRAVDPATGAERELAAPSGRPVIGAASAPGGVAVYAFGDGEIVVLEGERSSTLRAPGRLESITLDRTGRTLAAGSSAPLNTVTLWDLTDPEAAGLDLEGHTRQITSLAFAPDGRLLASGSDDQTVRLWSVPDGEPRGELRGHTDMVQSLAFSTDGTLLASGSEDFTIRIWAVDELRPIGRPLRAEPGVVWALAAGDDGTTLVAGNRTKVIGWAFGEESWTATACRLTGRELSAEEWAAFAPGRDPTSLCGGS